MTGFIYIWRDRKHNRYYIGSHWGDPTDRYICSSTWMRNARKRRLADFKRRIISTIRTSRSDLLIEEQRWLNMIKPAEIKKRYYNLCLLSKNAWHHHDDSRKTVGAKVSRALLGKKHGPRSKEVRKKISEGRRKGKKPGPMSDEHRSRISAANMGRPGPNLGKKFGPRSEAIRKKISEGRRRIAA